MTSPQRRPAPSTPAAGCHTLLIEDDPELAGMLAEVLREEGHRVDVALDGQRGLHLGLTAGYDLMIVDRGLPAVEGVDLLRRLRRCGVGAPVLLLTARGTVADRVEGLDAGAEDYLVKPFDLEELLARLRALLRRSTDHAEVLPVPSGRLVVRQSVVEHEDGRQVSLSPREAALLELLARRPRQVFSRQEVLRQVFDEADTAGVVDTYVHYLRRKLGRQVVLTVRGSGYRLGQT